MTHHHIDHGGRASGQGPTKEEDPTLAEWVRQQRVLMRAHRKQALPPHSIFCQRHINQLNAIGFEWEGSEWETMFYQLVEYKDKHGHCNVPIEYENLELVVWVKTQRENKSQLDLIGFQWNECVPAQTNDNVVEKNTDSPKKPNPKNRPAVAASSLDRPQSRKRTAEKATERIADTYKKKRATARRGQTATGGKAVTTTKDYGGNEGNPLQQSAATNAVVAQDASTEVANVSNETNAQLNSTDENGVHSDRLFTADPDEDLDENEANEDGPPDSTENAGIRQKRWEQMFQKLWQYKEEKGDTRVPRNYPPDQKLAVWVQQQARMIRLGKMSAGKVEKLNAIQFDYSCRQHREEWDAMFYQLVGYKKASGQTRVSRKKLKEGEGEREGQETKLALWVDTQRRLRRLNKLSEKKIERLNSIGFEWNAFLDKWEQMYNRLLKYKETHGHCLVPQRHSADGNLGEWVRTQRRFMRKGTLSADKVERLNAIGFEWAAAKGPPPGFKPTPKPQKRR